MNRIIVCPVNGLCSPVTRIHPYPSTGRDDKDNEMRYLTSCWHCCQSYGSSDTITGAIAKWRAGIHAELPVEPVFTSRRIRIRK